MSGTPRPSARTAGDALMTLDEVTRTLRRECPWDRAQDERSIVPHTVEEAYELADAAHEGDDAKLLDELGDVLFQVYFLALLLEERGAGSLEHVAAGVTEKLVRRHPHVYGEGTEALSGLPTEAATPQQVRENWDAIKRREAGSGKLDVPETLPALLYARKLQRRAAQEALPARDEALASLRSRLEEVQDAIDEDQSGRGSERLHEPVGDLLLAVVELARSLEVDPELALRHSANRLRDGRAATR
jgi:MazG family protein